MNFGSHRILSIAMAQVFPLVIRTMISNPMLLLPISVRLMNFDEWEPDEADQFQEVHSMLTGGRGIATSSPPPAISRALQLGNISKRTSPERG